MLNGTAIAISRAIIAILENFQQADGSVLIPPALVPYCGFDVITGIRDRGPGVLYKDCYNLLSGGLLFSKIENLVKSWADIFRVFLNFN